MAATTIQKVKRCVLDGSVKEVKFSSWCGRWLVKNFSSGDIYVSFEDTASADSSIKISSGMAQVCVINERNGAGQEKANSVYISGTGEVEVQQLWW